MICILLEADEGNIGQWWIGHDKESLKEAVSRWGMDADTLALESYARDIKTIHSILDLLPDLEPGKHVLNEYVKEPHYWPSLELIIVDDFS